VEVQEIIEDLLVVQEEMLGKREAERLADREEREAVNNADLENLGWKE
jgi:hypothetical protein